MRGGYRCMTYSRSVTIALAVNLTCNFNSSFESLRIIEGLLLYKIKLLKTYPERMFNTAYIKR